MNEQQEASTTSDVAGGDHRTEQVHEPSQQAVAAMMAKRLGETTTGARVQLKRIVQALGRTQARALLEETLRIEDNGGMLVPDGSRRRTPGGVFFYLASTVGQPKPGRTLMRRAASAPVDGRPQDLPQPAKVEDQPSASLLPGAPFAWEMRSADIDEIVQTATGRATSVKITLVGTMGTCVDKGACVVGVMQHSGEKLPALPKGVPAPQAIQTSYVVYIGAKQWKTVAATVSDPEDALIVEGFPQIDTKTGTIAVYVSSVTSKKLQAAKRQG